MNLVRLPTHAPRPPALAAAPQALCCMSPGCVYASIKREEKTIDYVVYKETANCKHTGGQGGRGARPWPGPGHAAPCSPASTALPPLVRFLGRLKRARTCAPASVPCAIN